MSTSQRVAPTSTSISAGGSLAAQHAASRREAFLAARARLGALVDARAARMSSIEQHPRSPRASAPHRPRGIGRRRSPRNGRRSAPAGRPTPQTRAGKRRRHRASRACGASRSARARRRRRNAASIGSAASNVHTRARICDDGENAARATNLPAESTMSTVSPGSRRRRPRARSRRRRPTGARRSSDFSRPCFRTIFAKVAPSAPVAHCEWDRILTRGAAATCIRERASSFRGDRVPNSWRRRMPQRTAPGSPRRDHVAAINKQEGHRPVESGSSSASSRASSATRTTR